MSKHRSCCPPHVHIRTGRLCSLGSACHTFPEVIAPIRPSDSPFCFDGELWFPSFTATSHLAVKDRRGLPDDWSILLSTRRGRTPRRLHETLDLFHGPRAAAFQENDPLGTGIMEITWLHSHGSHSHMPTHRRRGCPRRRKACYRPAGLRFDRAGFAPAGQILQISERYRSRSSFRTSLSWSLPFPFLPVVCRFRYDRTRHLMTLSIKVRNG